MTDVCDIEKLVELFNIAQGSNEDEDEENKPDSQSSNSLFATSADDSATSNKSKPKKVNPYSKIERKESEIRELYAETEDGDFELFETERSTSTKSDWKKTPVWDIAYRQQVTASDVFLGMGFKTTSSASCEDMVITIDLPGEKRPNIELKILKDKLNLVSPRFYLDLDLPHPVDPKRGNAQFNNDAGKMIVSLKMDRELDFLNF